MKVLINGKTTISIILACLIAFMLPVEVFAKVAPKNNSSSQMEFDTLGEAEKVGQIVTELKERRDEHTKHFRMDDGTIMAVSYDLPVHFKNDKGNWVEYNNTLVAEEEATPDEAAEPEYYTNKKSNIDIDIPADLKSNKSLRIKSSKGEISWEYIGQKESQIKIPKSKKKNNSKDKASVEKLTSTASYNNVYKDVNLDYVVSSIGVKENLVLQNKSAQNEFEIEYDVKGYKVKQIDDRTFTLNKKGKSIYTIAAPCMYDKKGNTSNNLRFEKVKSNKNKLRVKLIADKSFLNDSKTEYPVTIDPEVTLVGYANTETAFVDESEPNTATQQSTSLLVGKEGNRTYSGLVRCKNIDTTFAGKNIVSAKLNLFAMHQSAGNEIDVYPVTSSWINNTATYNNVTYDSEIIDYASIDVSSGEEVTFDITKLFKKWINGSENNNGVYLKSNNPYTSFGGYHCYYPERRPTFVVKYKEYTGLESNLTSHTVPCGQDAVLSVCDYTGSLSVKQSFLEENTARFPLSLYATYHSTRNATNEQSGYGWHYSFNQTIGEDDDYYKYIDSDGVDHYFKKESGSTRLSDEDDSEYTLIIDNDKIKIDNDSTTKTFEIVDNSDIYKLKIEKSNDNENNIINYIYNSAGYLTKITTLLGDYDIIRNDNHLITKIRYPSTKYMEFSYYSGTSLLKKFISRDGKSTLFEYTSQSNDGLINKIRYNNVSQGNVSGGGVTCTYNSSNKVSSITELGKNGASRKALSVTYNDDNTTEFKERENNNKTETYTFDNYGNTVSVLNANGMITNMSDSGSLSVNTGADSYTKNYIDNSNSPDTNYFVAGTTSLGNYNVSQGSVSVDTGNSYMNSSSLKIHNESGNQISTVATHNLSANGFNGKNITLSAYIKTTNISKIHNDLSFGAYVSIRCSAGGGTNAQVCSDSVSVTKTINGWDRVSATLEVPQNADTVTVILGLKNTYGTAWFDCIQLEESKVMNDYNALSNSDFQTTSDWKTQNDNSISLTNGNVEINGIGGEPVATEEPTSATEEPTSTTGESTSATEATAATYTRTETETYVNDVVEETNSYGNVIKSERGFVTRTYNRTYEVAETAAGTNEPSESGSDEDEEETGSVICNKYIYQEVDINKKDVSFVLTGTAKAKSVPLSSEYRTFGIALKIKYDDDETYSEDHYQELNAYTDAKQSITFSVTPDNSDKIVDKVAFAFVYGYNKNKMTVYNASLNYAYNGAKSEQSTEPETTEPASTEATTVTQETTEPENEDTLIDEELTTEVVEKSDPDKPYMSSQKSYDSNGNYVTSEVDEAGNTTTYTNDTDGNVTQITDGNNHTTSYTYDVHNNLTAVSSGNSSNTYTYNAYNELSKITHNGFDYNYTYSNFGEPASVKVGSQALITYTYDSNGNVDTATYGNGDYLSYTYDDYARLIEVKLNNTTTLATYIYNKKGQITKFTDGKSGETTEYCYDCNGNALYKYIISENGELLRVVDGEIERTKINGVERTITNGTDDDGKSYVQNGSAKITSESDDFGRVTSVKTDIDNDEKFSLNYSYKNVGTTNQTTNNVHEMTYKLGEGENATQLVKYKYSYDSNGNITGVWDNNVKIAEYTYDSLNQLTECADKTADKYFVYNYDNSGNITSIETYSLVNGLEKGSLEGTDQYSYATSGWKDQLVSYKNDSITYDNIGNPTSYRDGMAMSWIGRELQSISKNNNTYSFTYNLNGLRTKKSVNGTNTFYYYDDSNNLIGLKKGNTTVLFYYDQNGQVYSMTVGSNTYFFIKNLQGDVTKIIDNSGTAVANYAYDAWGGILATKNENGQEITDPNHIAFTNPFRYRGYVYDPETELYYLQSRYYDPKTGRFINADSPEYTDTYSGSPLSTNMFAFCENNGVNGYDPSGNWDIKEHITLCLLKNHKFSTLTWSWNLLSDILFNSSDPHSSPFHSRNNLNICTYLYNAAVDLKKSSHKKNKLVTIKITTGKKPKEGFNSDRTTYSIPEKYISYYNKDDEELEPNYSRTNAIKNYLNGKDLSAADKNKVKSYVDKYGLKYGLKYKLSNRAEQSKALLGLALHTIQDYFAHQTYIYYGTENQVKKYINNGTMIKGHYLTTTAFNHLPEMNGLSTLKFEDDTDKFKWRYDNSKKVTKRLYNLYYGVDYDNISQYISSIEQSEYGRDDIIYHYKLNNKTYYFNAIKFKLIVHRDKNRKIS